jgi:YVTN family beta-propeller protein
MLLNPKIVNQAINRKKPNYLVWGKNCTLCLFLSLANLFTIQEAEATRLPENLKTAVLRQFPSAKIRLDGSVETPSKELYLPAIPKDTDAESQDKIELKNVFPDMGNPSMFFFSNGWCYLQTRKYDKGQTIVLPENLPESLRQKLAKLHLVTDLIVPQNFALPSAAKFLAGELNIPALEDSSGSNSQDNSGNKKEKGSHGAIFVLSPGIGKITCLEEGTLKKLAELPTEGTPSGITSAQGKVYIADQSKNRVLKLDPRTCQFSGQIDLPKRSAPKGIVALPDGKLFYVSESANSSIAVYETANDRLLVTTKVLTGPSRMAVTPNGTILLVLNVPVGAVSILSTQNQKFLGSIKVGTMPNAIVISHNSDRAYVSNRVSNTVSVIDITKHVVLQTIATGNAPTGLTLDADETRLFIANAKDNTISVYDLKANKKIDDVKLPIEVDFPGGLTLLPDKKHILVSSEVTDTIGILDADTLKFEQQQIGYVSDESIWVPFL